MKEINKKTVREPQQERSIEKKKRIVQAGYELFSEVGYYGTNTAEIAKKAGVSTGIVYGYFSDKRDILICVLELYIEKAFEPFFDLFDALSAPVDISAIVPKILDMTIKTHKKNRKIHEALHSLASTDEAVNAAFIQLEDSITLKISESLKRAGIVLKHDAEKIHFAMDIVQSFCHECIFDKHEYIDYTVLKDMVIDTVVNLFVSD